MELNEQITGLTRVIQTAPCEVKAEAMFALFMEKGLMTDKFCTAFDGFFVKNYSPDIYSAEIIEGANKEEYLQLHLSRRGLYGHFPEGLFFQPDITSYQSTDVANVAHQCRRNRHKEKDIRKFFMPFEYELFLQLLQNQMEETRLLRGFQSEQLNQYFVDFWGINPHIKESFVIPLMGLLPYAHQIAGKPDTIARCLHGIISEPVRVRTLSAWDTIAQPTDICSIGSQHVGIDFVVGSQFKEHRSVMEFTIGPLENSVLADYLEEGTVKLFLQTFYEFFVPAEAEVVTLIDIASHEANPMIGPGEQSVLGYTSIV
ncbi:hypothetical protein EXU57_23175 [Segetibacter sp. 3557_3]|uniref:type VI secretion system baseplate subunit TssG n=1 Tax=Segetibacter sp. 3557_3 TaxID=2547429 RepID=UPI001058AE3E|nr:type VI secretion system baseplate subunit TssG [Segetibacter sp. 3557_3]TDH18502.1 hypothetical protein EXU57_23175 [Segetibacter sp. 3557_3]